MRCETCTHWVRWKDSGISLGTCKKVSKYWEEIDWDGTAYEDKSMNKDIKFYVQDSEDYAAYLYTRNDFGCVEYMEKANEYV